MPFPSTAVLEEFVPELARLASYPKSSQKQIDNFSTLMKTATLRWLIDKSLYDSTSDFFVEIDSEWFDCATWIDSFFQKIPNAKHKTLEYYLLGEYTPFYQNKWKKAVINRYQINHQILQQILNEQLFKITDKTLRNNFQRLSISDKPKLIKAGHIRGKYKKNFAYFKEQFSKIKSAQDIRFFTIGDDSWNFLDEGISTIAELLLTKINGSQRFFLQTEYIIQDETQEIVEDWANQLKEIWQLTLIIPIQVTYYSASKNTTNTYVIFPVCLHYYQRAYYLSAVGENPETTTYLEAKWYNFRLDRILYLKKVSWDFSNYTKFLNAQIFDHNQTHYSFTSDYIQEQLDSAYGLDFYRQAETMILRFNCDYYQRYIKDTIRHTTFKQIKSIFEVKNLINKKLNTEEDIKEQNQLFDIIETASHDAFYKLSYRVDDHNVIMRLRSWGANVEVLWPLTLREKMRQDIQQTCLLY